MEAIDRSRLLDLCDNDADEVHDLLALAVDVVQTLLSRTALAFERSDPVEVLSALHELRGSAANVGAKEIAALAGTLEEALRSRGTIDSPASELAGLRVACDRLVAATLVFQV